MVDLINGHKLSSPPDTQYFHSPLIWTWHGLCPGERSEGLLCELQPKASRGLEASIVMLEMSKENEKPWRERPQMPLPSLPCHRAAPLRGPRSEEVDPAQMTQRPNSHSTAYLTLLRCASQILRVYFLSFLNKLKPDPS